MLPKLRKKPPSQNSRDTSFRRQVLGFRYVMGSASALNVNREPIIHACSLAANKAARGAEGSLTFARDDEGLRPRDETQFVLLLQMRMSRKNADAEAVGA